MSEQIPMAASLSGQPPLSPLATLALALMRIGIGWHFVYEGLVKLLDPAWSAGGYLRGSTGPLSSQFQRIAADPTALLAVDYLNIAGLTCIGLTLMLGFLTRFTALSGILLLALYYIAYPPLFGPQPGAVEGSYLIVNKNLVELLALLVVLFLPAGSLGIDGIFAARRARRREALSDSVSERHDRWATPAFGAGPLSRRSILAGLVGVPFVGVFVLAVLKKRGWICHEEKHLAARPDARTGATIKTFDFSASLKDLKGRIPQGQIGKLKLSRMMLGGNLMGGWAHSRDLIYVSKLVKAYHHREKIFETFRLSEACGINAIITNPILCETMNDYWRSTGGKMQFISDCGGQDVLEGAKKSIDSGAAACYVHGGVADTMVAQGKFDLIEKTLELIRKNGLPAGIAGHKLRTVKGCVEKGIQPDFWMKTLHQTNYWSAKPAEECDNIWCDDPAGTIAFMATLPQPWIAYKILAAGAIDPKNAFHWAFASGADFICVGMYDFQIIEDANLAFEVLAQKDKLNRQRPWFA